MMMKYAPRKMKWRVAISLAALAGALVGPAAASPSATQSPAEASSAAQPVCPPSLPEDPDVAGLRDNQLDPEGAPKFKAALAKLYTKGPALLKQLQFQREKDWPALCRYRTDNARLIANGAGVETVFLALLWQF